MATAGNQAIKIPSKLAVPAVALAFFALWLAATFLFLAVWNLVSLDEILHNFASRDYPSTTGTVTASSIEEGTTRTGKNGRVVPAYSPKIRYTYEVNGKPFEGSRIDYSHTVQLDRRLAEGITAKYAAGTKVEVFYDPARPQTAALSHGLDGWDAFQAVMNGFWLFGLSLWVLGFVALRRRRAAELRSVQLG